LVLSLNRSRSSVHIRTRKGQCKSIVGAHHQLYTGSLDIHDGKIDEKPYIGIVSTTAKAVVIRGNTRDTDAQAMECFIDTVLLIGAQGKKNLEEQCDAYNVTHAIDGDASAA
jgi:hypothetical protein